MSKIVDLRPELPTVAVRPTRANPDIKVVIGNDGGNYVPKQLLYPDTYSDADITARVDRFKSEHPESCAVCERYASEQSRNGVGLAFFIVAVVGVAMATVYILSNRRK